MPKGRSNKKPEKRSTEKPVKNDPDSIVYDRRPVTSNDNWCLFLNRGEPAAPNGYIVSMPLPIDGITLNNLGGYIIRSRKYRDKLLLQVVKIHDHDAKYTINYFRVEFGAKVNGKKRIVYRHIITITSTRGSKQTRRRVRRRERDCQKN